MSSPGVREKIVEFLDLFAACAGYKIVENRGGSLNIAVVGPLGTLFKSPQLRCSKNAKIACLCLDYLRKNMLLVTCMAHSLSRTASTSPESKETIIIEDGLRARLDQFNPHLCKIKFLFSIN